MAHRDSASSSAHAAKFSLLDHHPSNSSGSGFSLASFQLHQTPPHHPPLQIHSFMQSQSQNASSSHPLPHSSESVEGSSGYNDFHQGFSSLAGQNFSYNYGGGHDHLVHKANIPDATNFPVISPEAFLNTLSVIQQKTQQLQTVVQLMVHEGGHPGMPQQQQALAASVASVISQLVVAAAGLLQQASTPTPQMFGSNPHLSSILGGAFGSRFSAFPPNVMEDPLAEALGNSMGSTLESLCLPSRGSSPGAGGMGTCLDMRGGMGGSQICSSALRDQSQGLILSSSNPGNVSVPRMNNTLSNTTEMEVVEKGSPSSALAGSNTDGMDGGAANQPTLSRTKTLQPLPEDHDSGLGLRDDEDDPEGENLPPGSYDLVEMDAAEILAEHTHFCEICGKGFKRDANLRMHMRGHGDEYKTLAALARPDKSNYDLSSVKPRRYSCPFAGCKRNKKHNKFHPLKTMLCVKNHYRRSHCPKMLTCNKCKTKKFSVVADLKTHEKHCGREKWQCSCGTTFSRKDKLFGHIGLFAGHTPELSNNEMENSVNGAESTSDSSTSGKQDVLQSLSCNDPVLQGAMRSNNFVHGTGQHAVLH